MATTEAPVEDDEAWLYGDSEPVDSKEGIKKIKIEPGTEREAGELVSGVTSGEEESKTAEKPDDGETEKEKDDGSDDDDDDDDDEDDEDDVQVTIGEIKSGPAVYEAPRNLFKSSSTYQKPTDSTKKAPTKGVDLEVQGQINGTPVYEFDLDSLQAEDKPWRKPGADITDYFNYGFNEDTWRQYCEKQRRLRMDLGDRKIFVPSTPVSRPSGVKEGSTAASPSLIATTPSNKELFRSAQPPPNRKMSGTIDVIGSTARDSRRPATASEPLQTTDSSNYNRRYQSTAPIGMPPPMHPPDYSMPPPGLPPPGMAPPGVPPIPGVSLPPPGYPSAPVNNPYEGLVYYPPPGSGPSSDGRSSSGGNYENRSFNYGSSGYNAPYSSAPSWDARSSEYNYYENRRSPDSGSEYSMSDEERDYRYSSGRREHYDRGDRESYYREKDRDRDRDRDRGRDRDRDKSRDRHRDRDRSERSDRSERDSEKHRSSKSSRKTRDADEESDHHRSKHKKSKRSKRDREEENMETTTTASSSSAAPAETPAT